MVFPRLRNLASDDEVLKAISRLEADHKLIDKIDEQIRERTVSGHDPDILRKRILLYVPQLKRRVAYFSALETG